MVNTEQYTLGDLAYEGLKTMVFHGKRLSDDADVLIEQLKSAYPSFPISN